LEDAGVQEGGHDHFPRWRVRANGKILAKEFADDPVELDRVFKEHEVCTAFVFLKYFVATLRCLFGLQDD